MLWSVSRFYTWGPHTVSGTEGFVADNTEQCNSCHHELSGFTEGHHDIGCTACHLGDASAKDKQQAHAGIIPIPGNLSDASRTCSTSGCHTGIDYRVQHSIMNTMSGVIAINRLVFGENHHGTFIADSLTQSPADNHNRDLCASCHLGAEKKELGPIQQESRGGGCLACHLNYTKAKSSEHFAKKIDANKQVSKFHPTISLQVSNDHCFGCHSRSGRISTSYEGWHETRLEKEAMPDTGSYRLLDDERVFRYVAEDIHHAKGLACIDCHGSLEVMGDGQTHAFQQEAELSQCVDCHFAQANHRTKPYDSLQYDTKTIIRLRQLDTQNKRFVQGIRGQDLTNVYIENNHAYLVGKINQQKYSLSPPAQTCQAPVHADVTCNACHTQWAPQCIDCHTSYDPKAPGFDLLAQKDISGRWNEDLGPFLADFPSLGVRESNGKREIITFVPGMIITLDQSGYTKLPDDVTHQRLFAPIVAHTISATGRDCKTCHANPNALGYGRGEFQKNPDNPKSPWTFISEYENWAHDSLPQDAWIGFLDLPKKRAVTHDDTRPFTVIEQQRILEVGRCLQCHSDHSKAMRLALDDFVKAKELRTPACLGTQSE
ncbi:MAG TPA: hypothetical protein ENK85_10745 [Saprospiraceae bacterium]|nr:hypothetical protein [Saprospiraceae bacterium]